MWDTNRKTKIERSIKLGVESNPNPRASQQGCAVSWCGHYQAPNITNVWQSFDLDGRPVDWSDGTAAKASSRTCGPFVKLATVPLMKRARVCDTFKTANRLAVQYRTSNVRAAVSGSISPHSYHVCTITFRIFQYTSETEAWLNLDWIRTQARFIHDC